MMRRKLGLLAVDGGEADRTLVEDLLQARLHPVKEGGVCGNLLGDVLYFSYHAQLSLLFTDREGSMTATATARWWQTCCRRAYTLSKKVGASLRAGGRAIPTRSGACCYLLARGQ